MSSEITEPQAAGARLANPPICAVAAVTAPWGSALSWPRAAQVLRRVDPGVPPAIGAAVGTIARPFLHEARGGAVQFFIAAGLAGLVTFVGGALAGCAPVVIGRRDICVPE